MMEHEMGPLTKREMQETFVREASFPKTIPHRKIWMWNEDGSVSVEGNVRIEEPLMKEFPVKFRQVFGDFQVVGCSSLRSLEGFPRKITGQRNVCTETHMKSFEETIIFNDDLYEAWENTELSFKEFFDTHRGLLKTTRFGI